MFASEWLVCRRAKLPVEVSLATPPDMPARPSIPDPTGVPRSKNGSEVGSNALLQAVAYIEINAVDVD